jgi:hypothetical protein
LHVCLPLLLVIMTSSLFLVSIALSIQCGYQSHRNPPQQYTHTPPGFSCAMHCWIALVLFFLLACSSANLYNVTESSHMETKITESLNDVGNKSDRRDYVVLENWFAAPSLLPVSVASSDSIRSTRCRNQSQLFLQELRNFTLWAVQSK